MIYNLNYNTKLQLRAVMKLPITQIQSVLERIINQVNVGEQSVIIFTALDVDALCTTKILTKFLKSELIQYNTYPVSSYTELAARIDESKTYEKVRLFIMINCGGQIDLTVTWMIGQGKILLIDCNKPTNHANVQSENIIIIDDQHSELQNAPTCQQMEIYQTLDEEFIQEMEEQKNKDEDNQEQDFMNDMIATKRKRNQAAENAARLAGRARKIKTKITDKVKIYYSRKFYSYPSSYIAYKMMRQIRKQNNDYLWFAIVGLTSVMFQQKLQKDSIEEILDFYKIDVERTNNVSSSQNYAKNFQKNSIKKVLDFQFPLLRHWSLYESIKNSGYMIAHLGLWDEAGNKKLLQFLNLIGLSVQQSKQLYKFMLKTSTQKLKNQIFNHAEKQRFKLYDITFNSFSRQVDAGLQLTASDYYYILTSILERSTKHTDHKSIFLHRVERFFEAQQLFDTKLQKINAGIEQAKKNLTILTKEALNTLEKNHIVMMKTFSFANIVQDTEDRRIFSHPNTLTRLAYILMQLQKCKKNLSRHKPFVLSAQCNLTGTSQMVGIVNEMKNQFSSKFQYITQKLQIDVITDATFMANFMIVPKQTMIKIIRQLGEA